MRLLIILLAGISLFNSCSKEENQTDDQQFRASFASQQLSRDSLNSLYLELITAHDQERFPTNRIFEKGKLYPFDESPKDTSFFVFKSNLLKAANEKNIFFLLENLDESILLKDGQQGIEAFTEYWELTDQAATFNSKLWEKLSFLLSNGGGFSEGGNTYKAPYFAELATVGQSKRAAVISGQGVRMRSEPNLSSKIVATLSYATIDVKGVSEIETTIGGETYPWIKVNTSNDQEGFVWGKYVQELEEVLTFEKSDGTWKIISLL